MEFWSDYFGQFDSEDDPGSSSKPNHDKILIKKEEPSEDPKETFRDLLDLEEVRLFIEEADFVFYQKLVNFLMPDVRKFNW